MAGLALEANVVNAVPVIVFSLTIFPQVIAGGNYSREVTISNIAHCKSCPKYFCNGHHYFGIH